VSAELLAALLEVMCLGVPGCTIECMGKRVAGIQKPQTQALNLSKMSLEYVVITVKI